MALRTGFLRAGRRCALRVISSGLAVCFVLAHPMTASAANSPPPSQSVRVTSVTVTAGGAAVLIKTSLTCRNPGDGVFVFTLTVAQNVGGGAVWTAGGGFFNDVIDPVPCDGKPHVVPYLMSAADNFPAQVNSGPVPRWRAKPLVVDADFYSTVGQDASDVRAWPGSAAPVGNPHVARQAVLVQHGTALRISALLACPAQAIGFVSAAVSQVGSDGRVRGAMAAGTPLVCDGAPHTYALIALAPGKPWRPGVAAVQLNDSTKPWGLYPAAVTVSAG